MLKNKRRFWQTVMWSKRTTAQCAGVRLASWGLSPGAPNSALFVPRNFSVRCPKMICIYQKMDCYGSIPGLLFWTSINLLAPFQDVLQLPLLLSSVFTCCVWRHVCTPKRFFMYFRLPKVCILCSISPKTMNCFVFFLSWGHLIFFLSVSWKQFWNFRSYIEILAKLPRCISQ